MYVETAYLCGGNVSQKMQKGSVYSKYLLRVVGFVLNKYTLLRQHTYILGKQCKEVNF